MRVVRGYAVMGQGCVKRGLMGVLGVNVFGKVGCALSMLSPTEAGRWIPPLTSILVGSVSENVVDAEE